MEWPTAYRKAVGTNALSNGAIPDLPTPCPHPFVDWKFAAPAQN